jgi:hypothetical protein
MDVYIKIHNASNQMGLFPATTNAGNKYIMTLVEVDGNYINAKPIKNRSAWSMVKAYLGVWSSLTSPEIIKPTTHLLDQEASVEIKAKIKMNCSVQLVSLDNHRWYLTERVI